jgi:MFS family permease
MDNIKQTSGEYFRSLIIVFFGLIIGQVIFGLLSFFLVSTKRFSSEGTDLSSVFIYVVPIFVLAGFILSSLLFKNRLKAIDRKSSLMIKLDAYRAALILRYALLEGPSMFAIVVYLVTGGIIFILLAALIVLYFVTIRPNKENVIKDLDLNPNEEQILNDPNTKI